MNNTFTLPVLRKVAKPQEKSVFDETYMRFLEDKKKVHQISDRLYLTSAKTAKLPKVLEDLHITHVLIPAIVGIQGIESNVLPHIEYKTINLLDSEDENILSHLPETVAWMIDVLNDQNNVLLVHCARGVSRSGSFIIAYIMKTKHMKYEDAYSYVKEIRSVVEPNPGFAAQLRSYESECVAVETNGDDTYKI